MHDPKRYAVQTYRQLVNAVLTLTLAAGVLTGCVTVVVPTATPVPLPSPAATPLLVHGTSIGTSDPFELAAGNYVVSWMATGGDCLVNLRLQGLLGNSFTAELASKVSIVGPMASPVNVPPLTGVPAGTYAVLAITGCSWAVALDQLL